MESSDLPGCVPQEEQEFGTGVLGFPTQRRPKESRREMATHISEEAKILLEKYPQLCGDKADTVD